MLDLALVGLKSFADESFRGCPCNAPSISIEGALSFELVDACRLVPAPLADTLTVSRSAVFYVVDEEPGIEIAQRQQAEGMLLTAAVGTIGPKPIWAVIDGNVCAEAERWVVANDGRAYLLYSDLRVLRIADGEVEQVSLRERIPSLRGDCISLLCDGESLYLHSETANWMRPLGDDLRQAGGKLYVGQAYCAASTAFGLYMLDTSEEGLAWGAEAIESPGRLILRRFWRGALAEEFVFTPPRACAPFENCRNGWHILSDARGDLRFVDRDGFVYTHEGSDLQLVIDTAPYSDADEDIDLRGKNAYADGVIMLLRESVLQIFSGSGDALGQVRFNEKVEEFVSADGLLYVLFADGRLAAYSMSTRL